MGEFDKYAIQRKLIHSKVGSFLDVVKRDLFLRRFIPLEPIYSQDFDTRYNYARLVVLTKPNSLDELEDLNLRIAVAGDATDLDVSASYKSVGVVVEYSFLSPRERIEAYQFLESYNLRLRDRV